MATFTFIMERDNDSDVVLSKQVHLEFDASPDITHMELCDQFKDFLSACGYLFNLNDQLRVVNDDIEFVSSLSEETLKDDWSGDPGMMFQFEDEM